MPALSRRTAARRPRSRSPPAARAARRRSMSTRRAAATRSRSAAGSSARQFTFNYGMTADDFRDALIAAIRSMPNAPLAADGPAVGVKDVFVDKLDSSYVVTYLGLLRSTIGDAFGLSVAPNSLLPAVQTGGTVDLTHQRRRRHVHALGRPGELGRRAPDVGARLQRERRADRARAADADGPGSTRGRRSA